MKTKSKKKGNYKNNQNLREGHIRTVRGGRRNGNN